MTEPGPQLVTVYVTNGVRTSAGPGPGALELPPDEAGALVRMRFAVYGDKAPGDTGPAPTAQPFTGAVDPRPPRAGTRHGISN